MRKAKWVCALSAVMVTLGTGILRARAEERNFSYFVTLTGTSDYMFRGISYSDNDPVVTSYIEMDYGLTYLGLYTSGIDYGIVGPWEQDILLGIRPVTGPVTWDLAALWYLFGNRDKGELGSTADIDYFEFKIGASMKPIPNLLAGMTVLLTPEQGYAATENISIEGSLAYDLPKWGDFAPQLTGVVGYSDSGTNQYYPTGYWVGQQSYTYWNAGLKVNVQKFFMDFRYWDTTIDNSLAGARFVFSAGVNLP